MKHLERSISGRLIDKMLDKKALSHIKASKRENHFLITLEIKPNARNDQIIFDGESFIAETSSPPVKGKANKSLIKILSQKLKISKSQISLVKGATAKTKIFEVEMPKTEILEICRKLQN